MIIVTGSNGQLAKAFKNKLPNGLFLSKSECDITNYEQLDFLIKKHSPQVLINCAAYTKVDEAETDVELCYKVNKDGCLNLSKLSNKYDFTLIHISTDYVYSGNKCSPYSEEEVENQINEYGKSKKEGEDLVALHCKKYFIFRTSWLYYENENNFVNNIFKLMKKNKELKIVYDQVGTPTYAEDLANAILDVLRTENSNQLFGIYNFSNLGVTSWYDLAMEIKITKKLDCNIIPIRSSEYPTKAKRPPYSLLDTSKFTNAFQFEIPYWKESLHKCLKMLL